jgi:hypothetical protein
MKTNLRPLGHLRVKELSARVTLLEKWLEAVVNGESLHEVDRQRAWLTLSDIVLNRAANYFKKDYRVAVGSSEIHIDRVRLLQEFMLEQYGTHTVRWMISAYRRRFSMFESYRQLQELSVPLPGTVSINTNGRRIIRDFNRYITICKQLGFYYYKADIAKVGEEYTRQERAKGKACTLVHLNAFLANCQLYQDVYNYRYNTQYNEYKS